MVSMMNLMICAETQAARFQSRLFLSKARKNEFKTPNRKERLFNCFNNLTRVGPPCGTPSKRQDMKSGKCPLKLVTSVA